MGGWKQRWIGTFQAHLEKFFLTPEAFRLKV